MVLTSFRIEFAYFIQIVANQNIVDKFRVAL